MQHLISLIHTPSFTEYLEHWSYIGVFVWFTIFDFIAPFPDEISLLTVGYLASLGYFNPLFAALLAILSFLVTDTISFVLARAGSSLISRRLRKPERHSVRAYVTKNLQKNLTGTIIAVCFIPRMRLWGPIVAGSLRTSFRRFIAADSIGVSLFTLLYGALGYFFGVSLSTIFLHVKEMQTTIFVSLLLVLGSILIYISGRVAEREAL